jgi:twitching motility protein PilJ
MGNSVWNLIIKLLSVLAVASLLLGTGLVAAPYFGSSADQSTGVLCVAAAAAMAILSLIFTNLSNIRLRREVKEATEIARQISHGELPDDASGSELRDTLRGITEYLRERSAAADRIASGDLGADIHLRSDSDVLGESFQNMIERLRLLVQTQDERDRAQRSIKRLLDEVSEVAAGDLTVHAEVTPEMTGAIGEALNSMTKNFRSLIKQVKDVTFQVGNSANAINDTTDQLARGSEAQSSQISLTTNAISNMAGQIQEVSENASLSAQVAADSLNNARYGTKAAQDNINAMDSIRKQVQETAKRIKKLGERSQEISQIVGLIDDLSDRTSLLALNASLQASAAGESGVGFAMVAEEVERLAERSNRLTQQIAALAQTIQVETKDVVASMEETIHEVVVGSTLADKAGQSLVEIEQVSSKLAELLQSISESARQQAKSSEDISGAMANISKVTELVQIGSNRASGSVKMLVELSDKLRRSVAPFKLPEDRDPSKFSQNGSGIFELQDTF